MHSSANVQQSSGADSEGHWCSLYNVQELSTGITSVAAIYSPSCPSPLDKRWYQLWSVRLCEMSLLSASKCVFMWKPKPALTVYTRSSSTVETTLIHRLVHLYSCSFVFFDFLLFFKFNFYNLFIDKCYWLIDWGCLCSAAEAGSSAACRWHIGHHWDACSDHAACRTGSCQGIMSLVMSRNWWPSRAKTHSCGVAVTPCNGALLCLSLLQPPNTSRKDELIRFWGQKVTSQGRKSRSHMLRRNIRLWPI